jgi:hypothetical protein
MVERYFQFTRVDDPRIRLRWYPGRDSGRTAAQRASVPACPAGARGPPPIPLLLAAQELMIPGYHVAGGLAKVDHTCWRLSGRVYGKVQASRRHTQARFDGLILGPRHIVRTGPRRRRWAGEDFGVGSEGCEGPSCQRLFGRRGSFWPRKASGVGAPSSHGSPSWPSSCSSTSC